MDADPLTRTRGRPRGRTRRGEATKAHIYRTAIGLIADEGYQATTLRGIAELAGVSPGLLYRYFPNKRAVVLELYDTLSGQFAERARPMPKGRWRDRFLYALEASREVLAPHRRTLVTLVPILVGDPDEGVLSDETAFSRLRVEGVFTDAVRGAKDAPAPELAEALGRLLYLVHLMVLLWWFLDRSPDQRATSGLFSLLRCTLPLAAVTLRLPSAKAWVQTADALARDALLRTRPVP